MRYNKVKFRLVSNLNGEYIIQCRGYRFPFYTKWMVLSIIPKTSFDSAINAMHSYISNIDTNSILNEEYEVIAETKIANIRRNS